MPDMLVNLFDLPEWQQQEKKLKEKGIKIRRAVPPEKTEVLNWIEINFERAWRSEADVAFSGSPPKIFIAYQENKILGFACYDTTARGFFGPTGVSKNARSQGIGKLLLLKSLAALKEQGYVYAFIGDVGPVEYYKKVCSAVIIEGSEKSIYNDLFI